MRSPRELSFVYEGWEGYNRSIVNAIAPLTREQLEFRATPDMRSVAEVAWHIADGRVDWFRRLDAPGSGALWTAIEDRKASLPDSEAIVPWLNRTWDMVQTTLEQWTVDNLPATYLHSYQAKQYQVSRQWTIWRIMCNDIHHGGQLSEILAIQGIVPLELTLLGGHLSEPTLVE